MRWGGEGRLSHVGFFVVKLDLEPIGRVKSFYNRAKLNISGTAFGN